MKRETPMFILFAALFIASMMMTGGPMTAAKSKRDQIRENDLEQLSHHERCEERGEEFCGEAPDKEDPFTGVPYWKDDTGRWCAGIELPSESRPMFSEGCYDPRPDHF